MNNELILTTVLLATLGSCRESVNRNVPDRPNIIIFYVDDLGFGDIGVNGAKGVETPNIDSLAWNGMNFTDAHSSAATCTPSRYSLLTGSYAFRSRAEVLPGDAPLLIDPNRGTLPSMLKEAGYTTGIVGKWHLGLGQGAVNWNQEIKPGPREVGFDYSFIIPATGDRVPCVFVENQKVVNLDPTDPIQVSYNEPLFEYPIAFENQELLKQKADPQHSNTIINGVSRIGFMSGGRKALWVDEAFPLVLTSKAHDFISVNYNNPFFLFFSFHDIHVPRIIHKQFKGKSRMGPRGDAIAQVDWCVGQLVEYVEELGLAENTLILFTSDNGPVLDDGYADYAVELLGDHKPAGPFRGTKYSILEAGTRMPTIVYWPSVVNPGVSEALISQVDLYASLARLVGQKIREGDAPDSEDHLEAWLGEKNQGREYLLLEADTFALRKGDWKYIRPKNGDTPQWMLLKGVDTGFSDKDQLFNLNLDVFESTNLSANYPELTREMSQKLEEILQ